MAALQTTLDHNKSSLIGSFENSDEKQIDELNLALCQTKQSILFRKKAILIKEEIQNEDHPLNVLIWNFKQNAIREAQQRSIQIVSTHINEFIDFLFSSIKEFYKFKTIQDHQMNDKVYETILRSQIEVLIDICKEVTIDK